MVWKDIHLLIRLKSVANHSSCDNVWFYTYTALLGFKQCCLIYFNNQVAIIKTDCMFSHFFGYLIYFQYPDNIIKDIQSL